MLRGTLYGIGVGPGDSSLLTLKAVEILQKTDVLCLPIAGAGRESAALSAAGPFLREGVPVEELLFPMSRDQEVLAKHWRHAAKRVAELLETNDIVTFITIGDPLTYSTFGHLLRTLHRDFPMAKAEVVPGVTSFCAAAALLKVPLVEKDERLAVVPAPVGKDELAEMARHFDALVILKVSADFGGALDGIAALGEGWEACLVSRCGTGEEMVATDPFALRGRPVDYLSLLVVKRRQVP